MLTKEETGAIRDRYVTGDLTWGTMYADIGDLLEHIEELERREDDSP